MRLRHAVLAACVVAVAHGVAAQAVGPDFQVNTYTTGYQNVDAFGRAVAIAPSGDFVVTWFHFPDNPPVPNGVFARRFDAAGTPQGDAFQVNTYTTGEQLFPSVAADDTGAFVVVWEQHDDPAGSRIVARRYDPNGTPQGPDFQVSPSTAGGGVYASLAMSPSGTFVVAWVTGEQSSNSDVFARRFNAAGQAQGAAFQVNTYTTGGQTSPSVAMDANGNFVVAWSDFSGRDNGVFATFAQRFDDAATRQGNEFRVGSNTTSGHSWPAAAMSPGGGFFVTWNDDDERDGSDRGIFGRQFDALGNPLGADVQVNTYTTGQQGLPRVSADVDGGFVVSWTDTAGRDGSSYGTVAQRYDGAGARRGAEFVVNSHTTGRQMYPNFAVNPSGQAVAVYAELDDRDGSETSVFGQRFSFAPDEAAPAVAVTSPNGGEILYTGFAFPITWTASDETGIDHVDVEYSTDAGSHWNPVPGCSSLPGTALACSWNAPGPLTTRGRIRVTATDAANNVGSDISNANYEIADGSPFVALTVPDAAGLSWQAGTTKVIKWSHNLGKNQACSLELNRNFPSGPWELITTNAVTKAKATSTYSWLVTSGSTSGATARIRLSWNADASIEDVSSNGFAITSRVKVTQPNAPLSWPSGATRTIKWTHNLGAAAHFNVGIDRNGDSVCEEAVASNVAASSAKAGIYSWQVCGASPARVCVTSTSNALDADVSDAAFSITGTPSACGP